MAKSDFLAVSIPADLRRRADGLIEEVRQAEDRSAHVPAIVDLISDLMEAGLESSFMRPLKEVGIGFVGRQTARVGLTSAKKGVNMVVRQMLRRMDDEQILYIVDFIDEMLVSRDDAEGSLV